MKQKEITIEQLHAEILEAYNSINTSRWIAARKLCEFRDQVGWKVDPFNRETFEEYVVKDTPFSLRTAQQLIQIWRKMEYYGVEEERLVLIPWSRLIFLVPYMNKDNFLDLLSMAESLTVDEIKEKLAEMFPKDPDKSFVTRRFGLTSEQSIAVEEALQLAKNTTGATDDPTALYEVALQYLEERAKLSLEDQIMLLERRFDVKLGILSEDKERAESGPQEGGDPETFDEESVFSGTSSQSETPEAEVKDPHPSDDLFMSSEDPLDRTTQVRGIMGV